MTEKSRAHYTFGDEGPASERLRRLAEGLEKIAAGEVGGIPIENVLRLVIAAAP